MQSLRVGVTAGRFSPKIRPNRFLGFSRGFHFLVSFCLMFQVTQRAVGAMGVPSDSIVWLSATTRTDILFAQSGCTPFV